MAATAATTTLPIVASTDPWVNLVGIVLVIVIVNIVKRLVKDTLSERAKDIVYPILSAVLVGLGMGLGVFDTSNISNVIAYLVAPSGLWITVNKVFGLRKK